MRKVKGRRASEVRSYNPWTVRDFSFLIHSSCYTDNEEGSQSSQTTSYEAKAQCSEFKLSLDAFYTHPFIEDYGYTNGVKRPVEDSFRAALDDLPQRFKPKDRKNQLSFYEFMDTYGTHGKMLCSMLSDSPHACRSQLLPCIPLCFQSCHRWYVIGCLHGGFTSSGKNVNFVVNPIGISITQSL
jgi:hypothetical protein